MNVNRFAGSAAIHNGGCLVLARKGQGLGNCHMLKVGAGAHVNAVADIGGIHRGLDGGVIIRHDEVSGLSRRHRNAAQQANQKNQSRT